MDSLLSNTPDDDLSEGSVEAAELETDSQPWTFIAESEVKRAILSHNDSENELFKDALAGFKAEASSEAAFDNVITSVGQMKDRTRRTSVFVTRKQKVAEKVNEMFEGL